MNELNSVLRSQAVSYGLCEQWQSEWSEDWDEQTMVSRFFLGLSFCMKNHFPGSAFLTQRFGKVFLRSHNIVVDDRYSLLNPHKAVVIGQSRSTIRFNGYTSGLVHLQGESDVKLTAKGRSRAIVHVWDNARLDVQCDDTAKVSVIRHSADVDIKTNGPVKISDRT